jgi:hypothetical protein
MNMLILCVLVLLAACQDKQEERVDVDEIVLSEEPEEICEWSPSCDLIGDASSDACEKLLVE